MIHVDLNSSVGDIAQRIVDEEYIGKFVIESVKTAGLDVGTLLNERSAMHYYSKRRKANY